METTFTPFLAGAGGLLIGLSAALGFFMFGRVVGISGLFASLNRPQVFPVFFALGLVTGPVIAMAILGDLHGFAAPPLWAVIVGGLLVGFGTRLGSGCTSGHGVCGLARFSVRSLVATLSFMAAGVATMSVLRGALGVL